MGWEDLRQGVIRTPLPPKETLLDDPLRLVRVIRFATRFQYTLDDALYEAMEDAEVHKAFREKVSRERIGKEVEKIFSGPSPLSGLHLIVDRKLWPEIFNVLSSQDKSDIGLECLELKRMLLRDPLLIIDQVQSLLTNHPCLSAMLAIVCLPFWSQTISKDRKPVSLIQAILMDSMKASNKLIQSVLDLTDHNQNIEEIIFSNTLDLVKCGKVIRAVGEEWRVAFKLSLLRHNLLTIAQWTHDSEPLTLSFLEQVFMKVEDAKLCMAYSWKPILSGDEIQKVYEVQGPKLGSVIKALWEWQYANPDGNKEEAKEYLTQTHVNKR